VAEYARAAIGVLMLCLAIYWVGKMVHDAIEATVLFVLDRLLPTPRKDDE
jgi:hypothetical protein